MSFQSKADRAEPIKMTVALEDALFQILAELPMQPAGPEYDDDIYMIRSYAARVLKRKAQS